MLALTHIEHDACPGCSAPLSETTEQNAHGTSLHKYEVPPPVRCWRCTALLKAQDEQDKDTPQMPALMWLVQRTS